MTAGREAAPQRVSIYNRLLLGIISILVFLAGVQLYLLSAQTDRFFAWTIALPLSAALIGAGYWSALVSSLLALREEYWKDIRSSLPSAITATTLLLAATLIHLDKFHLTSSEFLPRLAAWVWLIVYVIVPPAVVTGFLVQRRMPGRDPAPRNDLPAWMRGVLLLQVALTLTVGAALFILPRALAPAWAWTLTPLTARATGAWLCAYGVAALVILRENDLSRVRGAMAGLLAFGLLQLLALVRYPGSVGWGKPGAWLYVIILLTIILVNGAGLWANLREFRNPA